jgi:hypothetical protein
MSARLPYATIKADLQPSAADETPCQTYLREHDVRDEGDPWFPDEAKGPRRAALTIIGRTICDGCELWAACAASRRKRDVGIWGGAEWVSGYRRNGSRGTAVRA